MAMLVNSLICVPKIKWNNFSTSPTFDFWTDNCKNAFTMTTNTNFQFIQYKIIHRIHITQYKKHKRGLVDTDICSKCIVGVTDNYLHAVWACPPVQKFWLSGIQKLSAILSCGIPPSPSLCLLGDLTMISIPAKYKDSLLISFITSPRKEFFKTGSQSAYSV